MCRARCLFLLSFFQGVRKFWKLEIFYRICVRNRVNIFVIIICIVYIIYYCGSMEIELEKYSLQFRY